MSSKRSPSKLKSHARSGTEVVRVAFRLHTSDLAWLNEQCEAAGISRDAFIRNMVAGMRHMMEQNGNDPSVLAFMKSELGLMITDAVRGAVEDAIARASYGNPLAPKPASASKAQ